VKFERVHEYPAPAADVLAMLRQRQNTSDAPGPARKVIGDSVETIQREEWQSASTARFDISIPGKPGHLRGRIDLVDNGDGTSTERFDAEVKVNIPLVGGKLEGLIGKVLGSGLRRERETGLRWLAGDR
jgi:hypothetical protein